MTPDRQSCNNCQWERAITKVSDTRYWRVVHTFYDSVSIASAKIPPPFLITLIIKHNRYLLTSPNSCFLPEGYVSSFRALVSKWQHESLVWHDANVNSFLPPGKQRLLVAAVLDSAEVRCGSADELICLSFLVCSMTFLIYIKGLKRLWFLYLFFQFHMNVHKLTGYSLSPWAQS